MPRARALKTIVDDRARRCNLTLFIVYFFGRRDRVNELHQRTQVKQLDRR